MAGKLMLSGGDTEKDLEFRKSEVEHLRRLLAWMRTEYMLDEHMQAGYVEGLRSSLEKGFATDEQAKEIALQADARIKQVPQYVQQGIKMLTKMLREHDKRGDTVDAEVVGNRLEIHQGKEPRKGRQS